jgi:S-adenosylmethionine:tRNA ribosyltransferase-isomerase
MLTQDFNFDLPDSLIAQSPSEQREKSRLMMIHKENGDISHHEFSNVLDFLDENDVLVLNNTKVIKARLLARRETGAKIEIFLLEKISDKHWLALIKNSKKIKVGESLLVSKNVTCELIKKRVETGQCEVMFDNAISVEETLDQFGRMPVPPYIKTPQSSESDTDLFEKRYQTVFAQTPGSVAAPTAGLHFSNELLDALRKKNVTIEFVTLHVGIGTFKPIVSEKITDHSMHHETFYLGVETADRLTRYMGKRRIIAVGSTATRTLEATYKDGAFTPGTGNTNLFIYPGYKFKAISGLITNFHLPKSSLLVLTSAFGGTDLIRKAYQTAIQEEYRFFSFGDAMMILP